MFRFFWPSAQFLGIDTFSRRPPVATRSGRDARRPRVAPPSRILEPSRAGDRTDAQPPVQGRTARRCLVTRLRPLLLIWRKPDGRPAFSPISLRPTISSGACPLFAGPIIAREVLDRASPFRGFIWPERPPMSGLLFILMWTAWQSLIGFQRASTTSGSSAGLRRQCFFGCSVLVQLTLMLFFAPLAAATAVAHEKDRRTFLLLVDDRSPRRRDHRRQAGREPACRS